MAAGFTVASKYPLHSTILLLVSFTCIQSGIEDLETVTNDDDPEALLDGLLQAAVCDDLIGWREESRKLILAFTDQLYHLAGDGKVRLLSFGSYVYQVTRMLNNALSYIMHSPSARVHMVPCALLQHP